MGKAPASNSDSPRAAGANAPASSPPASSAPLRYHWLRLRAVCHPTEDLAKVTSAVRLVAGLDATDAEGGPVATAIESHHGGTLQLVEVAIERSRDVRDVLQRIFDIAGARAELSATLEARTDDDGIFYVRLDKQEAAQGRLVLTRGEDAIQARLKMEHYPATREAALASLAGLLAAARP